MHLPKICVARICATAIALLLAAGCGPTGKPSAPAASDEPRSAERLAAPKSGGEHERAKQPLPPAEPVAKSTGRAKPQPQRDDAAPRPPGKRTREPSATASPPDLPPVDEQRVAAQGIRKLSGKRLTLYTDLPPDEDIAALPDLFEQAFPQWCRYFEKDEWLDRPWSVRGALMNDKTKFIAAGLLPANLPPFAHGFSRSHEIWLYEQDTAYYRRSLLLHEATHAFMFRVFGDCGPPWYMEATAELQAAHAIVDGRLTLGVFPARREDAPGWGRIRLVRDAVAGDRAMSIDEILNYPPDAHLHDEPYAWCWALAALLDGDPRYRERFRELPQSLGIGDFNHVVQARFADDWPELNEQWRVFIDEIDYGYDLRRGAIEFAPGEPLPPDGDTVTISADRGWQSSGIQLAAGTQYRLTAHGRYQVADQPQVCWCEPNGVTIHYYHGRPLGMLLAAIRPDEVETNRANGPGDFLDPYAVGLETGITPQISGTLYLRVNESPAALADNAGDLEVTVEVP